jgi:hypothetical protein
MGLTEVLLSMVLWLISISAKAVDVGDKAPNFPMYGTMGEKVRRPLLSDGLERPRRHRSPALRCRDYG